MQSNRCNYQTLMYRELSRQIFGKISRYQFSWKSVQWKPSSVRTDGYRQTERHDETNIVFHNSASSSKNNSNLVQYKVLLIKQFDLSYKSFVL